VTPGLAQGKPWRQGLVPKRGIRPAGSAGSANDLSYGGSITGVGVVTGAPRIYLILWGSQWGTQGTNSSGYQTYSGDPTGIAPDLQAFFKGLGTGGETWSGVMTQYCQGVATGTQTCPSTNGQHVAYPTGGALAGVWEDTSAAAPSQATAHQIATEAVAAATHFTNFSPNAQYFIVSPHGTYPDGFNTPSGQFCAWHDYTADSTMDGGGAVNSPNGPVAFTNMPYVTDAGASCGSNFVNGGSAGTLDGVTIVGGHEYAETLTDTFPAGGWTDATGYETGDKCAWISSGQGASQDISLGTGAFAVQSTWANDYNGGSGGCEVSHAIVTNPSSVTVSNPGSQSTSVGGTVQSLQMSATDSGSSCTSCTYTATGLPGSVTLSSSGLFSGTAPKTAGSSTVTVTATDSSGNSGNTTFTWSWLAGSASNVAVSPSTASVGMGGSQTFTASATDQYGNPTSPSGAAWTLSGPGSISPLGGGSTTYTASGGAGSATVTATLNGHSASGTVTVSAVANPITNGGFEAGTLSGWTKSGASGAENDVSSANYPCFAGSYCAMLGLTTPTNGASNIAQTFTVPSGNSTVSFYYEVVCDDTVRYDWATATLKNLSTGRTSTILPRTCNLNYSWVKVSAAVTPGQRYTLTLTNRDDNYPGDPTYTLFDNVSVQ
jgi:serine protease